MVRVGTPVLFLILEGCFQSSTIEDNLCCGFVVYSLYYVEVGIFSEKAMASHSSILAWKIPWTEEPGGLQSVGSVRVGHD